MRDGKTKNGTFGVIGVDKMSTTCRTFNYIFVGVYMTNGQTISPATTATTKFTISNAFHYLWEFIGMRRPFFIQRIQMG